MAGLGCLAGGSEIGEPLGYQRLRVAFIHMGCTRAYIYGTSGGGTATVVDIKVDMAGPMGWILKRRT